jgi:uncharacterized protein (UPF0218 family)
MSRVVAELPDQLRSELKETLGPIYTDAAELLATASSPLVTVGDVVTYHVIEAGETPAVALVDEQTEREAVDDKIANRIDSFEGFDRERQVSNPAATLTEDLLEALVTAIDSAGDRSTLLMVDGEEDLATLPAILVAPAGASVVYGQPGEGMVRATVDAEAREGVRSLLSRMDGDTTRLWTVLGVDP